MTEIFNQFSSSILKNKKKGENNLSLCSYKKYYLESVLLSLHSILTVQLKSMHCARLPDIPASAKTRG